jgi:stringent starvation protein B
MKKVSLAVLVSLSALTGAAYAQDNGITMSTDPQKAADIEQHAQDVQSRQQQMESAPAPRHQKGMTHHKKPKSDSAQ